MAKLIGIVVGLVIFGVWMSIVGNPHVVETVIGLVLGIIAGVWVYRIFRRIGSRR
jgi:multisubunit Na+/H+ antiporter MnhE subunit